MSNALNQYSDPSTDESRLAEFEPGGAALTEFTGPVGKVLNALSGLCLLLASIALVVLVAVFGWLVFGRYVLNNTPTWVEQLALLLVVAITFLGSATLMHEDRHLGVTFVRDALPGKWRISVRLLGDVALTAFGTVMAIACSELVAFSWGNTLPMLGIPEGVKSIPAVICGSMIALFAGCRAIAGIAALVRGAPNTNTTTRV